MTTETFETLLPHMQPGEVRQVAAGTVISYTGEGGAGTLRLGPLYVAAAHLISIAPSTRTMSVGGQTTYSVVLSNPTNAALTVTPTVAGLPDGWVSDPAPRTLTPGAQVTVPLTVKVPSSDGSAGESSPLGDHPFVVIVRTDGGGEDQAGATLTVDDPLALSLAPEVFAASDGDVVTYTATITNLTPVAHDYTLSTSSLASGAALPPDVSVAAGQAVTVPVVITASGDLGPHPFTLTARDGTAASRDATAVLDIIGDRRVLATLSPSAAEGGPGVPALYHLDITNTASLSDTYGFEVALPDGWAYRLEANGRPVDRLSLSPSVLNAAGLDLIVTPSTDTAPGDVPVRVTVRSLDDPNVDATAAATLTVTRYGVQVGLQPKHTTMAPTDTGTWTVAVTNTGSLTDTYAMTTGGIIANSAILTPAALTLGPDQTGIVQVTAGYMDYNLAQTYGLAVTARSRSNPAIQGTDTGDVTFTGYHGVRVGLEPGDRVLTDTLETSYVMVITNMGNLDSYYTFTPSATPDGLSLTPEVDRLEVPAHMASAILLRVRGARAGTYTVSVRADSTEGGASDTGTATLTIGSDAVPTDTPSPTPPSSATPTGTATDTPTGTPASTSTGTPTSTSSATSTNTSTPTSTGTATTTPTSTPTSASSPSATNTPATSGTTPAATVSATATPTETPDTTSSTPAGTLTVTSTATSTVTSTVTSTATSTVTSTATSTGLPTGAATIAATPATTTPTTSRTPTATPVVTDTATPPSTGTSSPPASPTLTAAPSPAGTAAAPPATATSTHVTTPIGTGTPAATATLAGTTAIPTNTPDGTADPVGGLASPTSTMTVATSTSTAAGAAGTTPASSATGTPAMTPTATSTPAPTSTPTAVGTNTPEAERAGIGAPGTAGAGAAHPALRLDRAVVAASQRLCASGTGFLPGEPVTLAVDSIGVAQTTASPTGTFTACFAAPGSIVQGLNEVSAFGAQSRIPALASVEGQLSYGSLFYMTGASTAGGEDTELDVLNPQRTTGFVTLRFYRPAGTGAPFVRSLTVSGHTRATLWMSRYLPGVRGFGLMARSEQVMAVQMVVHRGRRNPYTSLGSGLLARQWYLAEGYTNLTFHETLYLLNPDDRAARVQVHLLPANGGRARVVNLVVPAGRTRSLDVNRLYPHAALAAMTTSDRPIAVERVLTFGDHTHGATGNAGTPMAATAWLFAEGSAARGFQTFLTILNPGSRQARVSALFVDTRGRIVGGRTIVVDGQRRGTMRLNDTTHAVSVATILTSDRPVAVERPFYLGNPNAGRVGASLVWGRNGSGARWTFPAGDTTRGAHESILVFNPNSAPLSVRATFYPPDERKSIVTRTITIAARARATMDIAAMPGLANTLHGVQLVSANGRGFVAEQTIYNSDATTAYSAAGMAQ